MSIIGITDEVNEAVYELLVNDTAAYSDALPGAAYATFNGTTSLSTVTYDAAINPATWTLEAWVKPLAAGAATARTVLDCIASNRGFRLELTTGNAIRCGYGTGAATTSTTTTETITHDAWQHIVVTYDATSIRIYLNGDLLKTTTATVAANTSSATIIGRQAASAAAYYRGDIDEVAVYSGAMTQLRIMAHYLAGVGTVGTYTIAVAADLPIAWWRFNEAVGAATMLDTSASYTGTYANVTLSGAAVSATSLAALATGGIHDEVPGDRAYPYITIGEAFESKNATFTVDARSILIRLHVWSQYRGASQAWGILARMGDLLDEASLTVDGGTIESVNVEMTQVLRDPDGRTRHGIMDLRVLIAES